jgi:hypothetical protein
MSNVHIVIRVGGSGEEFLISALDSPALTLPVPAAMALAVPTEMDPPAPTTVGRPYWMIWEDSDSEVKCMNSQEYRIANLTKPTQSPLSSRLYLVYED